MRGNRLRGYRRKLLDLAQSEAIRHYPLADLLPEGECVALDLEMGSVSLLAPGAAQGAHPIMKRHRLISGAEIALLLPLLDAYPDYCPYEVLFAHFIFVNPSEQKIEEMRQRLHQAIEEGPGAWDQEMRPVRNVISRLRTRLRCLGLTASVVLDAGYVLLPAADSHLKGLRG